MSDKKRTTVTTIETHEIWIIRRAMPELPDVEATDAITVTTPVSLSDASIDTRAQASVSRADGLGDDGQ